MTNISHNSIRTSLSNWMNEKSNINLNNLSVYAKALSLKLEDLFKP
jgi:hypothetical protein